MTLVSPLGKPAISHGNSDPLSTERFVIQGKLPLPGSVQVCGAKNAALPVMAACLLTQDRCTIHNVPDIEDIGSMARVLESVGARVVFLGNGAIAIQASDVCPFCPPDAVMRRMRASFLVVGPLLARIGEAQAPHPGGCDIGVRPVNVDIRGFQAMGAKVSQVDGNYIARSLHGRLHGTS